jgi:hypothetical protein
MVVALTSHFLHFYDQMNMRPHQYLLQKRVEASISIILTLLVGCKTVVQRQDVRPRVLRDVPAQRLAYRMEADVSPPANPRLDDSSDRLPSLQTEFNSKRQDDALIRTVASPDGRRILVLYGTESEPSSTFRIDLYSSDGQFLRNLIPPDLSCVFPETVSWSPDGNFINFIAHKRLTPSPTPTPPNVLPEPGLSPVPSPSIGPAFAPVASFNTEQIYICNRDGYDLKPLTSREGLIYFYFNWAPDSHGLVALACKEDEWDEREKQYRLPAGRPRLIAIDGKERLLDDGLTEALPVWSPDSSKVATAFETELAIYDASTDAPTQARVPLRDQLITASIAYEQKVGTRNTNTANTSNAPASPTPQVAGASESSLPASFNPIIRLEWQTPEKLYIQTAFVRLMPGETLNTFSRWHRINLSAQTAVLK